MIAIPIAVFVLLALGAIAFAAGPLARQKGDKGRWLLVTAIAVFVLGIGGGSYWMLGRPALALREVTPALQPDLRRLLPLLVARVRQTPGDVRGWNYLGRAYMTLKDPDDAARAFARGVALVKAQHRSDPELFSAYGEALVQQSAGAISDEAEAAFTAALAADPRDMAARFYLGLARASRGDKPGALALWQSLDADVPANSALHQILVDRIAKLASQTGGAPDPQQMVAGLAARLKADPNDLMGWQRLIRAWHVLGEDAKARDALATARKTFAGNKDAATALDNEAKEFKLN